MTGYIKLEAVEEGIQGEVHMEHVGPFDKIHLLHTIVRSLCVSKIDLMLFYELENAGILDDIFGIKPMADGDDEAKNPESKEARFDKAPDALKQVFMEDFYE